MIEKLKWSAAHWKFILGALVALVVIWAYMPSCATRKGAQAAADAAAAIASANHHKEDKDAATQAALKEAADRQAMQKERDALARDKAALTGQVARLRAALPPHPVVVPGAGVPGAAPGVDMGGVEVPEPCRPLVDQLYEVVDAQAALIAKHEEDDKKEAEFIASLERSEAKWKEAAEAGSAEADDLRRALAAKDIQLKAMAGLQLKSRIKGWTEGGSVAVLLHLAGVY